MNTSSFLLRKTPFGWLAVRIAGERVVRVTIGHRTQQAALRAVGVNRPPLSPTECPLAELLNELFDRYFCGHPVDFGHVPVQLPSSRFAHTVLQACRRIPYGTTVTYGELARRIGRPGAARAVGGALARNPVPIIVPCHRVLAAGRRLGGFTSPGGVGLKRSLLRLEGVTV